MIKIFFNKPIVFLFCFIAVFYFNSYAYSNTVRVAILPFINISANKNYDWISQGFSESLTSAFAQTGKFVVIERNQIKQLLTEQSFQKSGYVDEKSSVEIGKILGVDKLIVGSYQVFSGNISVNSRIVDIKTAIIDSKGAIANKRAKLENIFDLQEELCLIHSKGLIDNLSDVQKEQISQVTSKSTNSVTAYEYYIKGRQEFQLLNQKAFARALEYYNKALEIDNNYALVLSDLAQMYGKWGYQRHQNGQEYLSYLKQSLDYGKRAVVIAPNIGESHRGLSVAYSKNGDLLNAEIEIKKALELNPNDSESYFFLWKVKNEDENSENIKKAISLNPSFAPSYNDLGLLMQQKKDYNRAIEYFNKAIKINSGFTYAYMNLGNIYSEMKNYNEAILNYKKAIEIDPDFSYVYTFLGNAYQNINEVDKAIEYFNKAINVNPDFVHAYNNLANTYFSLKNYNEAILNYKKAININNKFNTAYYNLGLAYEANGEKQKAIEIYNEYIKNFPDSSQSKEIEKIIKEISL